MPVVIRRHNDVGNCNIHERTLGDCHDLMLVKNNGHTCAGEESAMIVKRLGNGRFNLRLDGSFTMGPDAAAFVAEWMIARTKAL